MINDLRQTLVNRPREWFGTVRTRIIALPLPTGKFPSIPLTIPERLPVAGFLTSRMFLFNFMVGFFLMAMVIVGKDIQINIAKLETTDQHRQAIIDSLHQWEQVIAAYPGYRDGYYQLALLETQLGNKQGAYTYTMKALAIDPDFKEGKAFVQRITR